MFLIEPFIWMFRVKNFKYHYFFLTITAIISWLLMYIIYLVSGGFFTIGNLIYDISILVVEIVLFLVPILCLTGYFWCLTDNIIGRDLEAIFSNVYDGKVSIKNVIELPEWNIFKFIWRGIASIFASLIMYIPFSLLLILIVCNLSILLVLWDLDPMQVTIATSIFVVLFALLIPGLLWNYGRRDSVVAVLNVPKAIYLMETYPLKYFFNSFLIVLFAVARSYIIRIAIFAIGCGAILTTNFTTPAQLDSLMYSDIFMIYLAILIVGYVVDCYWIFVNAYLLGTIAPPSEY